MRFSTSWDPLEWVVPEDQYRDQNLIRRVQPRANYRSIVTNHGTADFAVCDRQPASKDGL